MPEPRGGKQDEMIKVAFVVNNKPDLRVMSRNQSLKSIIQELVEQNSLAGEGDDYCLVYREGERSHEYRIVTEKNRGEMHAANKTIIEIGESPARSTARIIKEINSGVEGKEFKKALDDLCRMSVDPTFALEFFSRKGLSILMHKVSAEKLKADNLRLVLSSITSLLDQDIISLEEATDDREFIQNISNYINSPATDNPLLQYSLHILNILVRECRGNENGEYIERQQALTNLVSLLSRPHPMVKLNSLTLINTLLQYASISRKTDMIRMLSERPTRAVVLEHVLDGKQIPVELRELFSQQLYSLQYHFLHQITDRMMTKIEPQDSLALQKIKDLRSTAFDTDSPAVKNNTRFAQDYKKLGFNNEKDPTLDFMAVPPGVLALDCMDYFAKNHTEKFTTVVLENSCRSDNHECPFAASSVELVKLLTEILGIGQPPVMGGNRYYEMFFKTEYPFEEFYTVCVAILNRTWSDMKATREDFRKVFDVVREQIDKALHPDRTGDRPNTFEQFKSQVKSYADISRRWQKDAKSREAWEHSQPVKVLRQHLVQEVEELIQQQRINFMVEGTKFPRYKRSGDLLKNQFRYVKLHTNHKTLYAGDWNTEKSVPTIEDLEPVLQVVDIKDILQGSSCPFLKDYASKGKETCTKLALSVVGETSCLDCVAPDDQTYNYWIDGINTLLRRPMTSPDHDRERETLLDMEVKLRLLDLEGVDLPAQEPIIPPPPTHFNFTQTN